MIIGHNLEDPQFQGQIGKEKQVPFGLSMLTESAPGLAVRWLNLTDWYGMQEVHFQKGYQSEKRSDGIMETVFVLEGQLALSMEDANGHMQEHEIAGIDGWTTPLGRRFKIVALEDSTAIVALTNNKLPLADDSSISQYIAEASVERRFPEGISSYTIRKPWGEERWREITDRYVMKEITMVAESRSSVHYHEFKKETNYIISGAVKVILGEDLDHLQEYEFGAGQGWSVEPNQLHRVVALSDYHSIEVSTIELDDVIRLQDDNGRPSGKITTEHGLNQK